MSFEQFRDLWWAANAAADLDFVAHCWTSDGAFVPSDGPVVVHGSAAIARWMLDRRGDRPFRPALTELCSWRFPGTLVVAAMQTTTDGQDGLVAGGDVTLLAALAMGDGVRLRHVAEAAPAVLPQIIAAYKAQARRLFP